MISMRNSQIINRCNFLKFLEYNLPAKYIALSQNIIKEIELGKLTLGQRMPAIRKFAHMQGISNTTAINCYQNLVELGWLQVKPQSGYFVTQPFGKNNIPEFPQFKSKISQPKRSTPLAEAMNCPFYISLISPELIPQDVLNK